MPDLGAGQHRRGERRDDKAKPESEHSKMDSGSIGPWPPAITPRRRSSAMNAAPHAAPAAPPGSQDDQPP